MSEDRAIPTASGKNEARISSQPYQADIILEKLKDIDKKQNDVTLCLEDVVKTLGTLGGVHTDVKRGSSLLSGTECTNTTTAEDEDNGDLHERLSKTVADLVERQTQVMLLLETMNKAYVRDTQEIINQVRQLNEKHVDLKKDVQEVRNKWTMLRANIFGISLLVVGTSAFIVFTTVVIARKINKINQYYRISISDVVSDILKRNKASVNAAEIVSKLRDILKVPVGNFKPEVIPT